MRPVAQFEGKVKQAALGRTKKIQRVVIAAASHENEFVLHPVRPAKAEHGGVELRRRFRVAHIKRKMTKLDRADAGIAIQRFCGIGLAIEINRVAVRIGHLDANRDAGNSIALQPRVHAVF